MSRNLKHFLSLFIAAAFFNGALYSQPGPDMDPMPGEDNMERPERGHKGKRRGHKKGMFKDLNLTKEQKKSIKAIKKGDKTKVRSYRDQMRAGREAMKAAFSKERIDLNEVRSAHQKISGAKESLALLHLEKRKKIAAVLTSEQKSKLRAKMEEMHKKHRARHEEHMAKRKAKREKHMAKRFEKMKKELGLSSEQASKIKALKDSSKSEFQRLRGEMKSLHEQKRNLRKSESPDVNTAKSILSKMAGVKEQMLTLRVNKMNQIGDILTPAQRSKWVEMRKKHMERRKGRHGKRKNRRR